MRIEAKIIGETEKAWQIDSDGDIVWLPKGEVTVETLDKGDDQLFDIPDWLFKEKFPDG